MLRDALDFIFAKADSHANPQPTLRSIGARKRVVTLNGKEATEVVEPPLLQRFGHTLGSVGELVEAFGERPTAFVNEKGVTVILDESDRLEKVQMNFELSDQFTTLRSLADGVTQRALVRLLRTTLAGCVDGDGFLAIVRQLEFDVNRGNRSNVQHTKESMGRAVEKEVRANAGDVPEQIKFVVPLFTVPHDVPTEMELVCAVTLDIDNERIAIEPTGDSLAREQKRVLTEICSRLDSLVPDDSLVVFGSCTAGNLV